MTAPHRIRFRRPRSVTTALLAAATSLTCDNAVASDNKDARHIVPAAAVVAAAAPIQVADPPIGVQGTIPLPINQTFSGANVALGITQTGSGPAGFFKINNASNSKVALLGQTDGSNTAVRGLTTGMGAAGSFEISNINNPGFALKASTNSTFQQSGALSAINSGEGSAAFFQSRADNISGTTIEANNLGTGTAARFAVTGAGNQANAMEVTAKQGSAARLRTAADFQHALDVATTGFASGAGFFSVNNSANIAGALQVTTNGSSSAWAGVFTSSGSAGGVRITTSGGPGLQVVGGTKNAVVSTTGGARALYTEESSEVWFTDYGFARLSDGRVHIAIDSTFSETVNLSESYHVFLQTYGDAELVVRNRTARGFDVVLREGDERDSEFSYRLVAKRLGFERERLRRAPWADSASPPPSL